MIDSSKAWKEVEDISFLKWNMAQLLVDKAVSIWNARLIQCHLRLSEHVGYKWLGGGRVG